MVCAQADEAQALSDDAAAHALAAAVKEEQRRRDYRSLQHILSTLRDCHAIMKADIAMRQPRPNLRSIVRDLTRVEPLNF